MLTAYENYTTNHARITQETNPVIVGNICESVVEDYLENRLIWDELIHYRDKGTILGLHPIFAWNNRLAQIRAMSPVELIKLRDQLNNKIPRTRKLINDDPKHKDNVKRAKRLATFEKEIFETNLLLGLK